MRHPYVIINLYLKENSVNVFFFIKNIWTRHEYCNFSSSDLELRRETRKGTPIYHPFKNEQTQTKLCLQGV